MKNQAGIWQSENGTVFKLKETGKMKKVNGEFVPELVNDVMFRVNFTNVSFVTEAEQMSKETTMVEQIVKRLNEHPSL